MIMKKKIMYISCMALSLGLISCNDDFLEVYPRDTQTEVTAFVTAENFETYAWGLYSIFGGYNDDTLGADKDGGNLTGNTAGSESAWAMNRYKVPASEGDWDFSFIRKCNLMLDHIDAAQMSDVDKKHWRAVGLFFRSHRYFQLLQKFGDVPWIEHVLATDSEELYFPRNPRDEVAANILRDLKQAAADIRETGNGTNTVNRDVVNTFLSRFALFEGTWRKYHGLQDADTYLREAADAAWAVINTGKYSVNPSYDALFNSEDLTGAASIILFRQYTAGELGHNYTRRIRTGELTFEGTKDLVDSYLCSDGRPISTSAVFEDTPDDTGKDKYREYDRFRNRDRRLYLTICPPYNTATTGGSVTDPVFTDDPRDNEYIDIMNDPANASWTGTKQLPHTNFKGFVCHRQPNLLNTADGRNTAWGKSNMGYFMWKYYNTTTPALTANSDNTTDAPVFRYEEVLLNYAEAKCELGEFDQTVADQTVNLMRVRPSCNVAPMNVAEIKAAGRGWDPALDAGGYYDRAGDPVLWEIRRERRVEFVGEGFAFRDIRRWKIADLVLNKRPQGAWIDRTDYGNSATIKLQDIDGNDLPSTERYGYGAFFGKPAGWPDDHYYLYPLPLDNLALNDALTQNPGWTSTGGDTAE